MSDFDDYKQMMKEKFEREKEHKSGKGLLGGLFQSKDLRPENNSQNYPISDYELAIELQEAELKRPLNQTSTNVYDFRGNANPLEPLDTTRLQQIPKGSDVELNDYPLLKSNTVNYVHPSQRTINRQRSTQSSNLFESLKNSIKEQMTPTVRLLCYANAVILFFIFIILIKSI